MRRKVHFYNKKKDDKENETQMIPKVYGLKSLSCPPQVKELIYFERDLLHTTKSLSHLSSAHNTDTTLTFADKASNIYKLKKEPYNKMMSDSITTTYKKASNNIHNKIDTDRKKLMKDKDTLKRMLANGKNACFITMKDHKPSFKSSPKGRLINPAKNEIGRISKSILYKINHKEQDSLKFNQRKSTSEVIEWFLKIPNKN